MGKINNVGVGFRASTLIVVAGGVAAGAGVCLQVGHRLLNVAGRLLDQATGQLGDLDGDADLDGMLRAWNDTHQAGDDDPDAAVAALPAAEFTPPLLSDWVELNLRAAFGDDWDLGDDDDGDGDTPVGAPVRTDPPSGTGGVTSDDPPGTPEKIERSALTVNFGPLGFAGRDGVPAPTAAVPGGIVYHPAAFGGLDFPHLTGPAPAPLSAADLAAKARRDAMDRHPAGRRL